MYNYFLCSFAPLFMSLLFSKTCLVLHRFYTANKENLFLSECVFDHLLALPPFIFMHTISYLHYN